MEILSFPLSRKQYSASLSHISSRDHKGFSDLKCYSINTEERKYAAQAESTKMILSQDKRSLKRAPNWSVFRSIDRHCLQTITLCMIHISWNIFLIVDFWGGFFKSAQLQIFKELHTSHLKAA